jgi:hypothetical protein
MFTPDQVVTQFFCSKVWLPVQLCNAVASLEAPLHYPAIPNVNLLPRTKHELLMLGLADAQAAAHILGLPPLTNPTAGQCRQQIIDFIGCGMTG